jgi:hypothetical protein
MTVWTSDRRGRSDQRRSIAGPVTAPVPASTFQTSNAPYAELRDRASRPSTASIAFASSGRVRSASGHSQVGYQRCGRCCLMLQTAWNGSPLAGL